MDAGRFDNLVRSLERHLARRAVLAGIGSGLAAWLTRGEPDDAAAKKGKNKKTRKKPLHLNAYGCVNVGGRCRGKNSVCCSGICQGKKPKKGEKDKSRCVAHDTGDCPAGERVPFCGGTALVPCTVTTGGGTISSGVCDTTTGNAPYCTGDGECFPCKKDTDCIQVCGTGAACVQCPTGCAATGGTVCVGPPGFPLNPCVVPGPP